MSTIETNDDNESDGQTSTSPSYKSTAVIKYMATRTLGIDNNSNSFQGSLHNFELSHSPSNFIPSSITTSHGLASLVDSPSLSRIPSFDSIDNELIVDEHRDLTKLNDILTESILHYCTLDAHNRVQELQIEWLENNANKNSLSIEKMFRREIQTGRQLIEDTLRYKTDLEQRLNDIHQVTLANDQYYQQLLSKRTITNKELFEYQRKLAQNRAECEFIRYRIQLFNEEIQFYKLKNNTLEARKTKLYYELDEEVFSKQVLQMECQLLENEKLTSEDMHLAAIEGIRSSIDFSQVTTIQPSNYFREQLNHQLRRIRLEYNKKLQIFRDELHRKFEIEAYRHNIFKDRPISTVTREHEQRLEEYRHEKKLIDQQISSIRSSFNQSINQIELFEKQIDKEQSESESITSSQKELIKLEEIIQQKEQQLNDVLRIRTKLKQQIENYKEKVKQYQKNSAFVEQQPFISVPKKSILRTSRSLESLLDNNNHEQEQSISKQNKDIPLEEGTLVRFTDFDVQRDCDELNRIFNQPNVDATPIIEILCNRNVAQRLQIRDTYKNLFNQNLGSVIDAKLNGNSKKLLKTLLLSPIERDCFEFRRILKLTNIDENILIEIFFTRSNRQIKTVVNNYSKLFKTTLEQDLINIGENASKPIFLTLLHVNRSEEKQINHDDILDDARNLYETTEQWKKDGSIFIQLLSRRSNIQLKQIFDAYQQFSGGDIEEIIKTDIDPHLSRTLMAIVRIIRNRPRFFAYEIRKSLQSSPINEDNLNRIIISRCEIDMVQIKNEYEKISQCTVQDHIQTNINGDYQRALLELIRQRIESTNKESLLNNFLQQQQQQSELPRKPRRTVQWQETTVNNNENMNNTKQVIQFDCNNQAKSNTLSTINATPTLQSQFIDQSSHSNENNQQ